MTCRSGSVLGGGFALALLSFAATATAADLPAIKVSPSNAVPECATPGRLMAYLNERNAALQPKFQKIASEYMRTGEALGIRWDYAFFQMLLETGYLTYKGDVKPDQNNFAGLGATGNGARGESFPDVATGTRAHLEHLLMYSGERVENPVAERTRNVQEWGVLTSWHKGFSRPVTFADLAAKWAPGSRGYVRDMDTIAERFFSGICLEADPRPELVADVRGANASTLKEVAAVAPATKGQDAARRAVDEAKDNGAGRSALGAVQADAEGIPRAAAQGAAAESKPSPEVKILNAQSDAQPDVKDQSAEATPSVKSEAGAIQAAALVGAAKPSGKPEKKEAAKTAPPQGMCRVFTASYGGTKAVIIKAVADKTVNYTVLDVNEGAEKREMDAYINAYAKGGEKVAEFGSPSQALERAFELCPEG